MIPSSQNAKAPRERGQSTDQNTQSNNTSNSAEAQRNRVLEHLRTVGPATTIELRRDLDCMMPGTRIHELRHKLGYHIDTIWVDQPTECGKLHRVALYALQPRGGS